jgi:hypothetical protein
MKSTWIITSKMISTSTKQKVVQFIGEKEFPYRI